MPSAISCTIGNAAVLGGLTSFGYQFQSSTHAPGTWSALTGLPAVLILLAQLLAMAACLIGCWWLVRRTGNGASNVANRALRRPVLTGFAVIAFLLVINGVGVADRVLLQRCFAQNEVLTIVWSQALAGLVLWPLQIIAFVVLIIGLLHRHLGLSRAS